MRHIEEKDLLHSQARMKESHGLSWIRDSSDIARCQVAITAEYSEIQNHSESYYWTHLKCHSENHLESNLERYLESYLESHLESYSESHLEFSQKFM